MYIEQEERIKELEKKIKDLEFVHGLCDKFGSYKSIKKDAELIFFFITKTDQVARWIEIIDAFKQKGWAKSTIENHLRNLFDKGVLVKGNLPGEYRLHRDLSYDMDILASFILGKIYELGKKTWENKRYY